MSRFLLALALAMTAASAAAQQMYKCGTRWQDTPCEGQVKRYDPSTAPAPAAAAPVAKGAKDPLESRDPEVVRKALLASQDGAQRCTRIRANTKDAKQEHPRTRETRQREGQRLNCAQAPDMQAHEDGCAKAKGDEALWQSCAPYAKRKPPAKPTVQAKAKPKPAPQK